MNPILLAIVLSVLLAGPASAARYYVDYEGGDDSASGQSPRMAWKHSPGDSNAGGNAAGASLQPGDTVHFKGGVRYFGEIEIGASGRDGAPIVFDGNTDGSFGEGRAILDGAQVVERWQPVESAEQVGGNPRWREMVFADLDADLSSNFGQSGFVLHRDTNADRQAPWQRLFLIDGDRRVLPVAQEPKPSDPFYPDLPEDFYRTEHKIESTYPHEVYYEEGTRGNKSLPVTAIVRGGDAPVIQPFNGGKVSIDFAEPTGVAAYGFKLWRPGQVPAPERIAFHADGEEVHVADVNMETTEMQRFELPASVRANKLTYELRHGGDNIPAWTKLDQVAAFDDAGTNILEPGEVTSVIKDEQRLTQDDPGQYDGAFVGVRGGNNHVYFAQIEAFDPAANELHVPHFTPTRYDTTQYAFYNLPRFISTPGEWSLEPLGGGRTRVYLLPEAAENSGPTNIGYPVLRTAVSIEGDVSHVEVRGFLMQRYSGGNGGIATASKGKHRSSHIRIANNEIRFMSGQSGISLNHSDHVAVENNHIHHCPGWTVGTYVNRVNDFRLVNNRLDTNSGSGIRHYEAKRGVLEGNAIINHYGMHSSAINFYEGCRDILLEGNYIQNVIAINRSVEGLTIRNNVVDSQERGAFSIAMWQSGKTGGTHMKDITIENNTLVNPSADLDWSTSIFVQGDDRLPEPLVIRNNVIHTLRNNVSGTVEDNVYIEEGEGQAADADGAPVASPSELFIDPAGGDYRRKPGGPMPDAGADVPPPQGLRAR